MTGTSGQPSAAEFRRFLQWAEQSLRDGVSDQMPPAAQMLLVRIRSLGALTDAELEHVAATSEDLSAGQVRTGLASFAEMFSSPGLRSIPFPRALDAAVRSAVTIEQLACRHVLAVAAAGRPIACFTCIAHPGQSRCAACHAEHTAATHSREHELTCDWCHAVCVSQIFAMQMPLGSVTVVRNLAARRSLHVGPAYLSGIGACYRCRRQLQREAKTVAEVAEQLLRMDSRDGTR